MIARLGWFSLIRKRAESEKPDPWGSVFVTKWFISEHAGNEPNHARNKRRADFYQNYARHHLYSTIWGEVIRASGKWDYSMSLEITATYPYLRFIEC